MKGLAISIATLVGIALAMVCVLSLAFIGFVIEVQGSIAVVAAALVGAALIAGSDKEGPFAPAVGVVLILFALLTVVVFFVR